MPKTVLKYIVTGDTDVGKTSLTFQYCERRFNRELSMTVALDLFQKKNVELEGREFNIEIWDTAGQEQFRALTRQYYRDADVCLVVFDLTRRESFESVPVWMEHARANTTNPNLVVTLVGNKADCEKEAREVSTGEAFALAAEQGCEYRELSAKDADAVERVFLNAAERVFKEMELSAQQQERMQVIDGAGRLLTRYSASQSSSFGVSPGRSQSGAIRLHHSYQKGGGGLCC